MTAAPSNAAATTISVRRRPLAIRPTPVAPPSFTPQQHVFPAKRAQIYSISGMAASRGRR
jgi:hypothetical protein